MQRVIRVGDRIPPARLGHLVDGDLRTAQTESLFMGRRSVVIGVPGAFTPVCTSKHVPDFVTAAPRLKASGFDSVVCVASNDPWSLAEWRDALDPKGNVSFYSDGNLEFGRKMGLTAVDTEHFFGERIRRFMMILNDAVVERISVENGSIALTCTRVQDVLLAC